MYDCFDPAVRGSASACVMTEVRLAGLELGGTKCIASLAEGRRIIAQESVPTTSPDETLPALLRTLEDWAPFAALGIASFGPIGLQRSRPDYGFITSTPKRGWANTDVVGQFRDRFGVPIGFDTDVNAAALAEHRWGAAQGLSSNVYLTIGTGVGGGVVVEGRAVKGMLHPEMGHIRVRRDPADDFSGICPYHGDCLEGLISGPAIAARTGRPATELPYDHPVWTRVADELSQLLSTIVLMISPQRIAIGGGVAVGQPQLFALLRPRLAALLNGYVELVDEVSLPQLASPAGFGPAAGVMGAITLADAALDGGR